MEKIIDNKNGTYSFIRDGKILHTGKWGDKYVAPKVDKGEVIKNNKPNTPTKQADLKTKLGIPSFKPTVTQPTQTSTLGPVATPAPKFNLFDFSSLQTPKTPSIPFKSTGPVAQKPAIQSPMLPTTTPMDTFKQGLPQVQPQAPKPTEITEEGLDKIIVGLIREGYKEDDIYNLLQSDDFNIKVISKETPKEAPGLLGRLGERVSNVGQAMFEENPITSAVYGAGNIIGGLTDIGMTAIGKTLSTADDFITGGYVKEQGKELFTKLANTEKGKEGLQALSSGMESYTKWAKENPTTSRSLEGVVNIGSILPLSKVAQATGKGIITGAKVATSPIGYAGTGIKKAGEVLYKTAIKPNTEEAKLILKNKAGLGIKPITRADTALKSGIAGTETRIGVQSLKKADEIFKTKINPILDKSKEIHSIDDIFKKVEADINLGKGGELRKQELLNGLKALKEDYKTIGKKAYTTKELQLEKSSLDQFTPQKIFKGQDVANGYNQVKNSVANVMRQTVRDDLAKTGLPNAKELYRDYANLEELSKVGIKGLTDAGFKGGFGGFWTTLYEQATTPIKTIGGQVLYKVGDKLEFIGPKGINKLGDFIKGKVNIGEDGIISTNQIKNVNNNMNSIAKNSTGNAQSVLKPKISKPPLTKPEMAKTKPVIKPTDIKAGQKIDLGDGTYATKDPLTGKVVIRPKSEFQKKAGLLGGNMAFEAPKGKQQVAELMEKAGKSADEIWEKTGWEKGTDGKWRFEIDDSKAKYNHGDNLIEFKQGKTKYLGQILDHENIFKQYPEISNTKVRYDINETGGKFDDINNEIVIGKDVKDIKSTLLHEIQHYIQSKEGFARGGSPEYFKTTKAVYDELEKQKKSLSNEYGFDKWKWELLMKDDKKYNKLLEEGRDNFSVEPFYKEFAKEKLDKSLQGFFISKMKYYDNEINNYLKSGNIDPLEGYKKLAGETEARNVQTRLLKTPSERKLLRPAKTEDVARDKQIVKMDGGKAMSVSDIKKVVSPSDDLIKEAREYKTFDDFKKAQGQELYHGTKVADIINKEGFKLLHPEKRNMASAYGDGIYFTTKKADAKGFGGDIVSARVPNNIKLFKAYDSDAGKINTNLLKKQGFDGVEVFRGNMSHIVIFDPKNIKTETQLKQIYEQANKTLLKK